MITSRLPKRYGVHQVAKMRALPTITRLLLSFWYPLTNSSLSTSFLIFLIPYESIDENDVCPGE